MDTKWLNTVPFCAGVLALMPGTKCEHCLIQSVTDGFDCAKKVGLIAFGRGRAANNCRSSDNGRPKFANVGQNHNLGWTFCPANFLLQHLTISFTNKII